MRDFLVFFREYKQEQTRKQVLPWLQLTGNLLGKSEDVLKLTGNTMDEDKLCKEYHEKSKQNNSPHDVWMLLNIHYARLVLLCVLGEWELAEADRKKYSGLGGQTGTSYLKFYSYFLSGLTCLVMAGRSKRVRYYKRKANFYLKEFQSRAKAGCVNSIPKLKLMQAEQLALSKKNDDALEAYNQSIAMASRSGFRLVKGIACERAGEYLLASNRTEDAIEYLQQSFDVYEGMGVIAKMEQMERKYRDLTSFSSNPSSHSLTSNIMKPRSTKKWTHDRSSVRTSSSRDFSTSDRD